MNLTYSAYYEDVSTTTLGRFLHNCVTVHSLPIRMHVISDTTETKFTASFGYSAIVVLKRVHAAQRYRSSCIICKTLTAAALDAIHV